MDDAQIQGIVAMIVGLLTLFGAFIAKVEVGIKVAQTIMAVAVLIVGFGFFLILSDTPESPPLGRPESPKDDDDAVWCGLVAGLSSTPTAYADCLKREKNQR